MGEALLSGLIKGSFCRAEDITVTDVRAEQLRDLASRHGVKTASVNSAVAATADILLLAVKPQQMENVLEEIAGAVRKETIVISVAAGVKISTIAGKVKGKIVRAMPNMGAQVMESATAVSAGDLVSKTEMELVVKMFNCVGKTVVVDEPLMDAVTGISGSGPAYIYFIMEALIKAGTAAGLSPRQSRDLVLQTVLGSARMAMESGETPEVLRKMIVSPQGTTVAALTVLDERGVRSAFIDAVAAAVNRSKELG